MRKPGGMEWLGGNDGGGWECVYVCLGRAGQRRRVRESTKIVYMHVCVRVYICMVIYIYICIKLDIEDN